MPTRKTRDQLDAEMGDLPAEPVDESPPEPDAPPTSAEDCLLPPPEGPPLEPEPPPPVVPEVEEAGVGRDAEPALVPRMLGVLESLLFAAADIVPLTTLLGVLRELQPDLSARGLRAVLELLRDELRDAARGVRVGEVGGGYQLRTPSENASFIRQLVTRRPPRMTRPMLETLAIVAYRQPVTRGEIEEIRGVDSGAVLRGLLEKRLVKILGRKEEVGRPLLYASTREFLEFFALKDLKSLPTLKDFIELSDEHRAQLGLAGVAVEVEPVDSGVLEPVQTDDYTPVSGEDEVMLELVEAMDEMKQRDRLLRREVFPRMAPASEDGPIAAQGEVQAVSGDSAVVPGAESMPQGGEAEVSEAELDAELAQAGVDDAEAEEDPDDRDDEEPPVG